MTLHLPYPDGWETTGYELNNLYHTLTKARSAAIQIPVAPYQTEHQETVMVQFPWGYIADIPSVVKK